MPRGAPGAPTATTATAPADATQAEKEALLATLRAELEALRVERMEHRRHLASVLGGRAAEGQSPLALARLPARVLEGSQRALSTVLGASRPAVGALARSVLNTARRTARKWAVVAEGWPFVG